MQQELNALAASDLLRSETVLDSPAGPRITVAGRELLCFCSNDYLGLANDPVVKAAAIEALGQWGVGAGASRLVSGTMAPHAVLEKRLAQCKRTEAALVASTGWMANQLAIHALVSRGDLLLCDKLDHASILDAARSSGATMRTYHHRDTDRLVKLLETHRQRHRRCLIVTDSLFSMDGDVAPLTALVEIKHRFEATLLIDEAHATGVFGPSGRGVAEHLGVEEHIDAVVGTLSKALGAMGGFVAGPASLIETLRNRGRPYIYTTAPPPAICVAAGKALDIVETQPHRRRKLLAQAERFRQQLVEAGLDTRDSASQIIPILVGEAAEALRISRQLTDEGFYIPAIRPPTVPPGTSRLRISLCSGYDPQQMDRLAATLARLLPIESKTNE